MSQSKPLSEDESTIQNINNFQPSDENQNHNENNNNNCLNNKKNFFSNNKNCIIGISIGLVIIVILIAIYQNYKNKGSHKEKKIVFGFGANMSFAININKNGSFSEHIYTTFDYISQNQRDIDYKKNIIKFYESKQQLEVAKKTILTDEIKDKLIKNEVNNNKNYVLISHIVGIIEATIDKSKVNIKEYLRNKLRDITKSNSTNKKDKFKNITDQIGFYIPNEVISGGRIDISFAVDKNYNISNLTLLKNKIFNPEFIPFLNSFQRYENYSCNVIGGEIKTFCEDKNLTKWYESLTKKNLDIIQYNNLETIGDFLDEETKKEFRKQFYNMTKTFADGIYHGDMKNNSRNGYGIFEYFNGDVYLGEWKDDKRDGEHGILKDKNFLIYNGDWKDDKKNGNGVFYEKGKKKYEGEWKNDLYDGKGIIYFNKNEWIEAEFKKGKCKKILNDSSVKKKFLFYKGTTLYCWMN